MPTMQNYKVGLQQQDPSPYWNPATARQKALTNLYVGNNTALEGGNFSNNALPKFDWGGKAAQMGSDTAQLNYTSALNATQNAIQNAEQAQQDAPNSAVANPRMRAILQALGAQESGNNYGAVNSDSGAAGRWQVMPSNIEGPGGWDMEALGRNVSMEDFLSKKRLQNKIVRNKFGGYLDEHGLKGALSAWYSGDPNKWNDKDSQGNYPSIYQYVMDVLAKLGK